MSHRSARRLVVSAVVLPLLVGFLAGCAASTQPDDGSATASASACEAPGSASAGGSPSGEASGCAVGKDQPRIGSEVPLDRDTLVPAMKAAMKGKRSVHTTMDLTANGTRMSTEGDVRFDKGNPAMAMTMSGAGLGPGVGDVEMRLVDGLMYLSMPPLTPRGKFVKLDANDPANPLGSSMRSLTEQMDPLTTFDAFEAGLRKVRYVGPETVAGEQLHHYRLTLDTQAASKASKMGGQAVPGMPPTLVYDAWLDGDNLMRRFEFSLQKRLRTVTTMSDWGEALDVTAPPARLIVPLPQR